MKKISFILLLSIALSSCLSSVSNKIVKQERMTKKEKALAILNRAWLTHGMDQMSKKKVYEVIATNHWKGIQGKFGKLWPNQKQLMKLQYAVGTFDSKVTFLNGKKQGEERGLQAWKYYVKEKGDSVLEFKKKTHRKTQFGLAAFHYFFELLDRLKKVDLIAYAGEKTFNGNQYELVFITWEKLEKHPEHDQYVLWINKKTNMMDYVHFTVHDTPFPGNMVTGSVEFTQFKTIEGVKIPFEQIVYVGDPKANQNKYLHKLTVNDFKFDAFDKQVLYPKKELISIGDSK